MGKQKVPVYYQDLNPQSRLDLFRQVKFRLTEGKVRDLMADGCAPGEAWRQVSEVLDDELSEEADDHINRHSHLGYLDLP